MKAKCLYIIYFQINEFKYSSITHSLITLSKIIVGIDIIRIIMNRLKYCDKIKLLLNFQMEDRSHFFLY